MITGTFSVRKRLPFWTLLIFLPLMFSLMIFEFGLRLIYREEEVNGNYWGIGAFSGDDSTGYVHAPGYEGYAFRLDVFDSFVKINSLSLRQEDLEGQLQYPVKLLVLGDSFAFGLGVLEEQSFPSLIKKDLNAIDVGIINGAQSGYSVEQERLFGVSLIDRLKPNIVILGLYAENDISGDYKKRYNNIEVKFGYLLRKDRWLRIRPFDFLRTHSYLWMKLDGNRLFRYFQKRDRQPGFWALTKTSMREAIRPTLDAIALLRDYCETNGVVFGVMTIPPKSGATVFDEHLKVFFQAEEIAVLNLGSKNYGEQDYLSGDGHWNREGHEKASQFLVPFVVGLLE